MRRFKSVFFAAVLAASCGADDSSDDVAECLSMGEQSPTYPARYSPTTDEFAAFDEAAAAFEAEYSNSSEWDPVVERNTGAVTGKILLRPRFTQLPVSDAWSAANAHKLAGDFAERWSQLFNPYDVDLKTVDCEDNCVSSINSIDTVSFRQTQTICGLELSSAGAISVNVEVDTGFLQSASSNTVPQRPMPYERLDKSQALEAAIGASYIGCGRPSYTVSSSACVVGLTPPRIKIETTPDGASRLYRLIQVVEIAPNCDSPASAVVTLDAIERSVLGIYDPGGCDD